MPKLSELKAGLEKLPEHNATEHFRDLFGAYRQRAEEIRGKLAQARNDREIILKVTANQEFGDEILKILKSSAREAKLLHKAIQEDASKVGNPSTDDAVTRLNGNASTVNTRCRDQWKRGIEKELKDSANLALAVQQINNANSQDYQNAVRHLNAAKERIPQSEAEAENIGRHLEELRKGITSLGLEGEFGKFLKDVGDGNCLLGRCLEPEVKKKLDEFNLWDTFHITL